MKLSIAKRSLKLNAVLFATVLAATSLVQPLQAQESQYRDQSFRLSVPFAFEVGSHHFAAGIYTIHMNEHQILTVTTVTGTPNTAYAMVAWGIAHKPSSNNKVVFQRYGNQYFLEQLWASNSSDYLRCFPSKAEARAREMAANQTGSAGTEVAVLQIPR